MENISRYDVNYNPLPEMNVQIGHIEGSGNTAKFGITLSSGSQTFNVTHIGEDGKEISFTVSGQKKMDTLMKGMTIAARDPIDSREKKAVDIIFDELRNSDDTAGVQIAQYLCSGEETIPSGFVQSFLVDVLTKLGHPDPMRIIINCSD